MISSILKDDSAHMYLRTGTDSFLYNSDSDLQTIGWLELQYCGKLQVPMLIAFPWAKF